MLSGSFRPLQAIILLASAFGVLTVLQACSARDVYEIAREHQRQDCELQPIALQASCRAQYEMSYAEYERLRAQEGLTEKR